MKQHTEEQHITVGQKHLSDLPKDRPAEQNRGAAGPKAESAGQKRVPTELGTEPVGRLLRRYAVPAIIAMTASSLYNMVDSIFIGQGVGPLAISGLAVTFPLMNLAAAFGAMVGVGASTILSVKLGQHDYNTARRILGNVVTLNLWIGILFSIVTLSFLTPILGFFGASEQTVGYARDYMTVILAGNVISHMYFGLNAVLRAAGHPDRAMYATILAVVINTILDPLFIYGFGWGIRGAAVATILAQVIALTWQLRTFSDRRELLHLQRGTFGLNARIVSRIISIGMSPFLMNTAACMIVILINTGLRKYEGDLAIGAFGIANRIVFLFIMIVMGLNQGMQPIVGYNYGARQYDRVNRALTRTLLCAVAVNTCGFLVGQCCPRLVASAFTSHPELIESAARGLRIITSMLPIVAAQMVATNFFQSLGMARQAIFLSMTRQILFLTPLLLLLPLRFGVAGVWASLPVSDLLATIVSCTMLWQLYRKFNRQKPTLEP